MMKVTASTNRQETRKNEKSRPLIQPGTIQRMTDEQWQQSQIGFARLTQKQS